MAVWIGVAGLNASGKGEVVAYLERRSFYGASLSDVIREDLARDGLEATREQRFGDVGDQDQPIQPHGGRTVAKHHVMRQHLRGKALPGAFQPADGHRHSDRLLDPSLDDASPAAAPIREWATANAPDGMRRAYGKLPPTS